MAPDKDMPKELEVFVKDLNNMYLAHPALYQLDDEYDGFEWVQLMKYEENVIAFMRKTEKKLFWLSAISRQSHMKTTMWEFLLPANIKKSLTVMIKSTVVMV